MAVSVQPTFNCLAVKDASEMGPRPEPRLRALVRRRRTARRQRRATRNRRGARAVWAAGQDRRQMLVMGDRRSHVDQFAVVAMVGFVAVALGFIAARL